MKSVSHQQFVNRKTPKRQRALDSYCPNCGFRVSQHQQEDNEYACPKWGYWKRLEHDVIASSTEEEVRLHIRGFMQSASLTRRRVRSFFYCVKRHIWINPALNFSKFCDVAYRLKDIDQHKLCPRRVKALKAYLIQQALKGDEQCPF